MKLLRGFFHSGATRKNRWDTERAKNRMRYRFRISCEAQYSFFFFFFLWVNITKSKIKVFFVTSYRELKLFYGNLIIRNVDLKRNMHRKLVSKKRCNHAGWLLQRIARTSSYQSVTLKMCESSFFFLGFAVICHSVDIQGGTFKWEHLNISVIYGFARKLSNVLPSKRARVTHYCFSLRNFFTRI